jgi:hypothetical protein
LTITQLLQLTLLSMVDRETSTWREVLLANPLYVANGVGQSVAMCVLLIALVAAYDRQADAGGTLGVVGVGAAVLGTVHLAGNYWFEAFVTPWLATVAPRALPPFTQPSGTLAIGGFSSYVLFALGWLLFGIAGLRARVLPAAISLAIMVGGMLGFFALMPPFGAPLGLAVAASGAWMLRTRPAGSLNPIAHASPT